MSNLTSQQCLQVGRDLSQLQLAIADYQLLNFTYLSNDQKNAFAKSIKSLSDAAGLLIASTVTIALEEAETSIQNLTAATKEINDTLTTIAKVQDWIDIAGAAFNLASAILSFNVHDIVSGIKEIVQDISAANNQLSQY